MAASRHEAKNAARKARYGIDQEQDKGEARFRQVVEFAPSAMVLIDAAGKIDLVNAQTEHLFGYPRAEMLGEPVEMLVPERFRHHHPDLRNMYFNAPSARLMGAGRDLFARRKDGSEFPVEIGLNPIETDSGPMVLSAIIDISDRRQKTLTANYLAAIVESSGDAIIGMNLDGVVMAWNPAAESLFGYSAGEIVGRHVTLLIAPERVSEEEEILKRIGKGERVENFETVRRAKSGRDIHVSLTVSPIRDNTGKVVGASKIVRDATERNEAAASLRLSEERFRSIVSAVTEGIFIDDVETGTFIDVNEPGASMLGYTVDELIGRDIQFISSGVPPYSQAEAIAWLTRAERTGRPQLFDWSCRTKDGRIFLAEISLRFASISGRRVVLAIVRDVEERRTIEAQLRQAQKMEAVGQLTGGIAHDFNNLLAIIHGNLELIKEATAASPDIGEMATDALHAAARGASLTYQLLAYSRQQPLAPKTVQLNELVARVTQLLRRTLGETIEVRTSIPDDLWATTIDPAQLENALVNLAVNARDAMAGGGKLTIEGTNQALDADYAEHNREVVPGDYVRLAVSDSGTGIPKAVLDRVFEPFFTTKPVGKGTGLGLSMVFGFVRQSGGHIKIYSEPGLGTTVNLYLPRAVHDAHQTDAPNDSGALRGSREKEVIFILEDDDLVRKFAVRVLRSLGYTTIEAADGPSALHLLNLPGQVDLLLTDVALPKGMTGTAVAREALKQRPDMKVLFMSGYAKDAIVNSGFLDEGVHLLSKPFPKAELARNVREILDGTARP